MELLVQTIKQEVSTLNKNNIRLCVIGNIKMLPVAARKETIDISGYNRDFKTFTEKISVSFMNHDVPLFSFD